MRGGSMQETLSKLTYIVGTNVANLRKQHNLTVRELGVSADVSYTVIYDLENFRVLPKVETIIKLANALGTTFEKLFEIKQQSDMKHDIVNVLMAYYGINKQNAVAILKYVDYIKSTQV